MKKLNSRFQDSIGARFEKEMGELIFLSSPSDMGVRRNQGRPGARHAPECLLYQFKKLNHHLKTNSFSVHNISQQIAEQKDFEKAQEQDIEGIFKLIQKNPNFIHLGGGHDHVYPLLSAIEKLDQFENILIINIDAHLDTRIDNKHHSGTPFRNFDEKSNKPFFLYQYGIHNFANAPSTQTPLKNHKMFVSEISSIKEFKENDVLDKINQQCPFEIDKNTFTLISLDCDALHSSYMQAVSAVNHHGIGLGHCLELIKATKSLKTKLGFGIYEFNPIYDDIAGSSARSIAYLMHEYIKLIEEK